MRGLVIGVLLAGVLLGFGLGLGIAWYYWPISYSEAEPVDLRTEIKDDYIRMTAAAYSLDGDLANALRRMGALQLARPLPVVANLTRNEKDPLTQQALTHLGLALQEPQAALARPTFTPRPPRARAVPVSTPIAVSNTPTATPFTDLAAVETATPEPTFVLPTSTPNPDAPRFTLKTKTSLSCAQTGKLGRIEVEVRDSAGHPLPGIGIEVSWNAGSEIFYTGLKPERGVGYADFDAAPGVYSVRLVDNAQSDVTADLKIADENLCAADNAQVHGWNLAFQRVGD